MTLISVPILALVAFVLAKPFLPATWRRRPSPRIRLSGVCAGTPEEVAWALRKVISAGPRYSEFTETAPDRAFHFNCRPDKWTMGTEVDVELQPTAAGTQMTLSARPEWFVRDDMVERHRSALHDFVMAMQDELLKVAGQGEPTENSSQPPFSSLAGTRMLA